MSGRPQKPRDQLVFTRGGRAKPPEVVEVEPPTAIESRRPAWDMPADLDPRAAHIWESAMALASKRLQGTDVGIIYRWIWGWHEWFREADRYEPEGGVTAGALGTSVANPRLRVMQKLEASIERCEKQLGFTPLERMRQNIKFVEEQTALDKLKGTRPAGPIAFPKRDERAQ